MARRAEQQSWEAVLDAGVAAQRAVPGCIAVGGTAAALYAHHRFSNDTDHLLPDLRDRFDDVRELLEASPGWKTARVQPPVLILGSIGGVEVGLRQSRRQTEVGTTVVSTPSGPLVVPTLDELIGMKAYMAYSRGTTRDFLDFAALAELSGDEAALASLEKSDQRYGHLQAFSVAMEIAKTLSDPSPVDLADVDLKHYKGLIPRWHDWTAVADVCRRIGHALAEKLVCGD